MRTLNQLYVILLTHWQEMGNGFICVAIDNLEKRGKIDDREHLALMRHFQSQNPDKTQHTEFTLHESWYGSHAWWIRDEVGQRELFLQKMIELTDTRTPLQRLAETIEQENEIFESLSRPQKRVKIAEDCLKRLKIGQLMPKQSTFATYSSQLYHKPIKETLNCDETAVCSVCAKGSLFMSYVGRVNQFLFEGGGGFDNFDNNQGHKKLFEVFTYKQLSLIEFAFEGRIYMRTTSYSDRERQRAYNFYKKYTYSDDRLIAICENIIKNKGTFKL